MACFVIKPPSLLYLQHNRAVLQVPSTEDLTRIHTLEAPQQMIFLDAAPSVGLSQAATLMTLHYSNVVRLQGAANEHNKKLLGVFTDYLRIAFTKTHVG